MTFETIEAQGTEALLEQLRDELTGRTYKPLPARRQEIPKDGGKKLSAAERRSLNQALAKALAFRDAGKMEEAREWAAELVRLLKSHDLVT